MQFDAVLPFNELHNGRPAPQGKIHLHLFRALVADDALKILLLLCRQASTRTRFFASYWGLQSRHAASFVQVQRTPNTRPTEARRRHNPHHRHPFAVQPNSLLAQSIQLLQRLNFFVCRFHQTNLRAPT